MLAKVNVTTVYRGELLLGFAEQNANLFVRSDFNLSGLYFQNAILLFSIFSFIESNYQLQASKKHAEAVEAEAKTLTDQIHNERESNSQLRAYIARVQSEDHAREKWKTEKEDVESKINVRSASAVCSGSRSLLFR